MKQTFTSARRPLEILIHIIGWGIMFGFPFFFVERGNGNINWWAYVRHAAVPLSFMIVFYATISCWFPATFFRIRLRDMLFTTSSYYVPLEFYFISGRA